MVFNFPNDRCVVGVDLLSSAKYWRYITTNHLTNYLVRKVIKFPEQISSPRVNHKQQNHLLPFSLEWLMSRVLDEIVYSEYESRLLWHRPTKYSWAQKNSYVRGHFLNGAFEGGQHCSCVMLCRVFAETKYTCTMLCILLC